jgi:hypothetical protein
LISIAIEHEFEKEDPFSYDVSIPEGDYEEYAFLEPAAKIIAYLKTHGGMSLETMVNMRDDIGVPDRDTFLLAFKESMDKGILESYKPRQTQLSTIKYDDTYLFFRVKGTDRKSKDKIRKKATKYEQFIKLKKELKL